MTQKTGRLPGLTSEAADRLVQIGASGPNFENGRTRVIFLDPSTDDPVSGVGIAYEVTMDGPELEEFTVRRAGPDAPRLTRRLVRDAPVDAIAERARQLQRSEAVLALDQYMIERLEGVPIRQQDGTEVVLQMPGVHKHLRTAWSDFKRPGRRGRPDIEYALIAAEYVDEVFRNGGLGAAKRVAEAHDLSPATIRNLLYEATRRGFKTPAAPGMAGGKLTGKAIELLCEMNATP